MEFKSNASPVWCSECPGRAEYLSSLALPSLEFFRMAGYNRMKKSDAKEINGVLEHLPGWERQKSAIRFGGEYGHQRGFLRRDIPGVDIRPPNGNV